MNCKVIAWPQYGNAGNSLDCSLVIISVDLMLDNKRQLKDSANLKRWSNAIHWMQCRHSLVCSLVSVDYVMYNKILLNDMPTLFDDQMPCIVCWCQMLQHCIFCFVKQNDMVSCGNSSGHHPNIPTDSSPLANTKNT